MIPDDVFELVIGARTLDGINVVGWDEGRRRLEIRLTTEDQAVTLFLGLDVIRSLTHVEDYEALDNDEVRFQQPGDLDREIITWGSWGYWWIQDDHQGVLNTDRTSSRWCINAEREITGLFKWDVGVFADIPDWAS